MQQLHQAIKAITPISDIVTISHDGWLSGGGVSVLTSFNAAPGQWSLELPTELFGQVIDRLKKFTLWLEGCQDSLAIRYDHGEFNLVAREPEENTSEGEGKLIYRLVLNQTLLDLANQAIKFSGDEYKSSRYRHGCDPRTGFLDGVAFWPHNGSLTIAATDGQMLFNRTIEYEVEELVEDGPGFRLYMTQLKLLNKFLPIGATILAYDDGSLVIECDGLKITRPANVSGQEMGKNMAQQTMQMTEEFVGDSIILADTKPLIRVCQFGKEPLDFTWQDNVFTIASKTKTFKTDGIIAAGANFTFRIDPNLLATALNIGSEKSMFKFTDGNKTVAINGCIIALIENKDRQKNN